MQSILEREIGLSSPTSPNHSRNSSSSGFNNRSLQILIGCIIFGISLYIAFFWLPAFSETDYVVDVVTRSPSLMKKKKNVHNHDEDHNDHNDQQLPPVTLSKKNPLGSKKKNMIVSSDASSSSSSSSASLSIQPWGYNKNRNIPRWKAIRASIKKDIVKKREREKAGGTSSSSPSRFVLVDYGSDQGFFSISAAHEFAKDGIFVVSVEMGGVGGEIWKKGVSEGNDVLSIQEKMVSKYVAHHDQHNQEESSASSSPKFMICQTKISPKMFFDLNEHKETHRYQFVLSVFHWFDLPTRKDFEAAIVTLFKNAQSTFIELPTIGDRSALIRKQVGWNNFEKWYDGRSDIKQIILDAAKNENFPVHVEKIVSVPWVKWTRDMYRVDWASASGDDNDQQEKFSTDGFHCKVRREEIYHCNSKREKLQECI